MRGQKFVGFFWLWFFDQNSREDVEETGQENKNVPLKLELKKTLQKGLNKIDDCFGRTGAFLKVQLNMESEAIFYTIWKRVMIKLVPG